MLPVKIELSNEIEELQGPNTPSYCTRCAIRDIMLLGCTHAPTLSSLSHSVNKANRKKHASNFTHLGLPLEDLARVHNLFQALRIQK